MKCLSCSADIPPQWVAAIAKNECPGCSGPIMTPESQELLDDLSAAMKEMPNNPQGLAGWLLTHYRLVKIGTGEPTKEFHTMGARPSNDPMLNSDGVTEFAKRAGIKNQEEIQRKLQEAKDPRYKQLYDAYMKSEELEEDEEIEYDDEDYSDIDVMTPQMIKQTLASKPSKDNSDLFTLDADLDPDLAKYEQDVLQKRIRAQRTMGTGGFKRSK